MTPSRRARHTALELLAAAGIIKPPINVEDLVIRKGIRVERRPLEDHVSGCLIHDEKEGTVMLVNANHAPARQNFTMAHELGHLCLHREQQDLFVDNQVVFFRVGSGSQDPMELEANTFAATLLMPPAMLNADLKGHLLDALDDDAVVKLARRYRVSQQALTIQLVGMGLLDGIPRRRG